MNPVDKRNGDFHCFCVDQVNQNGYYDTWYFQFKNKLTNADGVLDSGDYCKEWIQDLGMGYASEGLAPFLIVLFNIIGEIVVYLLADFRRPVNDNHQMISSMTSIAVYQFLNMGLCLIFATVNLKFKDADHFIGFLDGEFDDFNVGFYLKVAP